MTTRDKQHASERATASERKRSQNSEASERQSERAETQQSQIFLRARVPVSDIVALWCFRRVLQQYFLYRHLRVTCVSLALAATLVITRPRSRHIICLPLSPRAALSLQLAACTLSIVPTTPPPRHRHPRRVRPPAPLPSSPRAPSRRSRSSPCGRPWCTSWSAAVVAAAAWAARRAPASRR